MIKEIFRAGMDAPVANVGMVEAMSGRKVLFVANTAFFVNNFLLGMAGALKESGCSVAVICPEDPHAPRMREKGMRVIPLQNLHRKGMNPIRDLMLMYELLSTYRRERPDLVLHFTVKPNIYGGLACRLLGLKAVNVITGLGYLFIKKSAVGALAKSLYRFALHGATKVAFLNRDDLEVFRDGGLVREEKVFLLPGTGIDASHYRSRTPSAASGTERASRHVVFLMLGRILWDKGIGEFVEAAASVKQSGLEAEFWILGAPDAGNPSAVPESFLREKEALGIIRCFGQADDVREIIALADVVVLPSYREGIPRALLEAMAMEKPIIASDATGCRDVVEHGRNGMTVRTRDALSLSEAMASFISMGSGRRAEMGRKGREKVLREYDDTVVGRILLAELADALNS